MDDKIIDFISQYITLTAKEIDIIKNQNFIKTYAKGTWVLSKEQIVDTCFFVIKGSIRKYYLVDGEERSTDFYLENQTITPAGYLTKATSEYYLECMEDSVLALGSEERNTQLLEKVPKLQSMVLNMNNSLLIDSHNSLDDFKKLSPEKRYLKLLEERPELLQRIPLKYLASYLGITSVSLSRIRKRVTTNKVP
ncbi:Crp/Fnr family transcriptional regulator [Flagellimonas lutimaris]|uniref:Crp/Fnr family transcriptional regulator n=1 Tax=Flagellimonas lutimaris TaxID=475082 RepID=A0A3A1NDT4_9FLAO|nr:Crp/Fnr family transcriptional regulator [Allomuricauda lutimaris]RIV36079.1 Crp/Fnr family transcriptional regulator [Allomuricauda lutimaris]